MTHALAEDRNAAEQLLKEKFGFERFHDHQWEAISRLLKGERVLMIERTGFGKSLCFQFPALLLDGITIIFSPLIALMRDQVAGLRRRGIPAECLNSENPPEENDRILRAALAGELKILYIAPERQENELWSAAAHQMKIAMVVIDEAHTISVWGHDFRPSFRRIIGLVRLLPPDTPVLAVTATATPRVQTDIERQIGGQLITLRGDLLRDNFRFHVIEVKSEEEKMIWLARHIDSLPGSGIIYTGTRSDTSRYADWLRSCGVDAECYNAGLEADDRKTVEHGLMESRWKCIVSTNALGMGIDKNDIRFVVHTQIPASPVHYYQEIGRAGRDGLPSDIILFFNSTKDSRGIPADCRLPLSFINNARPSRDIYLDVIKELQEAPLSEREVMMKCNLKQTEIRIVKADLLEQGIVCEMNINKKKVLEYQYDAPELDTSSFEELRKAKLKDLEAMVGYVNTEDSRMEYLCRFLGDATDRRFAGCDNTSEERWTVEHDSGSDDYAARLSAFEATDIPELVLSKAKKSPVETGAAAGRYRESAIRTALADSRNNPLYSFPEALMERMENAFRSLSPEEQPAGVTFVPHQQGDSSARLAKELARRLGLPCMSTLRRVAQRPPQREYRSAFSKKDNVAGAFEVLRPDIVEGHKLILVDDFCDSGATLLEAASLLVNAGAMRLVPITLAKTEPGDL